MADATPYGKFLLSQTTGASKVDFDSDTIKGALLSEAHTPDLDTHEFYSDLTNEIAAGDGYTTGGVTLTSVSGSYSAPNMQAEIDCDDPAWTFTADKTFRYLVYYKDTGTPATSPLIALVDYGAGGRTENGAWAAQLPATGFLAFKRVTSSV